MKRIVLLLVVLLIPSFALAEDIYLTHPTAQGNGLGGSCANGRIYSFFNSGANWGVGTNLIGPGDTVHICGVWTGAADAQLLAFQGSGTAGSVITLIFESGAILEAPHFTTTANSGAIVIANRSYILVDGGSTCGVVNHVIVPLASCNGIIRTTANGSALTFRNQSFGIVITGNPVDLEIRNLVTSMYQRVDPHIAGVPNGTGGPLGADGELTAGIRSVNMHSTNLRIHHNNFQHNRAGIWLNVESGNTTNTQIYNNYVGDQGWGILFGGFGTNTFHTNLQLHDNEITEWTNWVSPANTFHSNGFFIYDNCAKTTPEVQDCFVGDANSNIYNNYVHGDLNGGFTQGSASGFIHAPARSNFNIFNNLLVAPGDNDLAAGAVYTLGCVLWAQPNSCGGGIRIYNNTISLGKGRCVEADTLTYNFYTNNICQGTGAVLQTHGYSGKRAGFTILSIGNYNIGYNFNGNHWECENTLLSFQPQYCKTLALWQTDSCALSIGCQDANSLSTNPLLDSNYRPQVGSPAINAGTNLTSLGISALNVDYWGAARPASGAWTIGAMNLSDTLAPAAPTNITVQ